MVAEYDARLLESVAVRRQRLREVLLWGGDRRRLAISDNVKRIAIGLIIAAVISAGCVGWALITDLLSKQDQKSGAQVVRLHAR